MTRSTQPTLSVLMIDPRPVRAGRFLRAIDHAPELSLTGAARELSEAYHLTEHQNPDLVLLAEEVVHRDNFPMYGEMLAMLEIEALVIAGETGAEAAPSLMPRPVFGTRRCLSSGFPRVTERRIEESGGLVAFLSDCSKLARILNKTRPLSAQYGITAEQRAHALSSALTPGTSPGTAEKAILSASPAMWEPRQGTSSTDSAPGTGWKTIVIGASTGGVEALIELFSAFPEHCPPTLVVQHINGNFLPGLAQRLDRHCLAHVRPAASGDPLEPGQILMAPGNTDHLVIGPQGRRCRLVPGPPKSGHRPSVDMLFHSAASLGKDAVGVILTGMGRDGAEGLLAMRRAGATTFAQDRASSTVYGMPRAAMEMKAVAQELPISKLAPALLRAAATSAGVHHG